MPRDPYEVLGVSKSASAEEIQKAYRKLSKEFHPNRNPGDKQAEANYKEVQAAIEILSEPAKEENLDRLDLPGCSKAVSGGVNFGGPGS
jgi:DnaJ-class molecular chaperone